MAMTTLASINGFSQPLSLDSTNNNMRDVSFSSYLNNAEETFVRKLAESSRDLTPKFSVHAGDFDLGRKKAEDNEIGVFSAEKYFKGGLDETNGGTTYKVARKYQHSQKHEQNDIVSVPMKSRSVHSGTPSIRSESSWNSQSTLLQSALRNPSRRKTKKVQHGKNFLAGLGCKCYCSDKDSVAVDEHVDVGEISFKKNPNIAGVIQGHDIATEIARANSPLDIENKPYTRSWSNRENRYTDLDKLGIGLNNENCFTFPTLNSATGNVPVKIPIQEPGEVRKSLEVFGAPILDRRNNSERLDKRLTMMSWDATPRMEELHFPDISDSVQDDNASDASSDLFEIESLTGKVGPFLARQGSDANSDCVTPTCYAPSEASVEWSVVTASAADISVMSDYEELRPTSIPSSIKKFPAISPKTKTGKEMSKRRPGILGCKSNKAVNVAGDAYKTTDKAKTDSRTRRVSDSYMPVTRFQNEAMMTGLDSIPARHALATRSLPRPFTPRASNLLYIQ